MMDSFDLQISETSGLSDATMLLWLCIACGLAIVTFIFVARPRFVFGHRHAGGNSQKLLGVFLAVLVGTVVLLYPILREIQGSLVLAVPQVSIRVMQALTLDNGMVDVVTGLPNSVIGCIYYDTLALCYIALPILAVANIYDLVKQQFSDFVSRKVSKYASRGKNVYAFSDPNEDTISLARDISERDDDALIVFTGISKAKRDEMGTALQNVETVSVYCLETDYVNFAVDCYNAGRYKALYLLAISAHTNDNISETCSVIEALRGGSKYRSQHSRTALSGSGGKRRGGRIAAKKSTLPKIYVEYDSSDDEIVLDAANTKGRGDAAVEPLPLVSLHRENLAAFALLLKAPLYRALDGAELASPAQIRPKTQTDLHVLILGSGSLAEILVCNVLWAGQMHNVNLHVDVLDVGALKLEERMRMRYPALFDGGACEPPSFMECELISNRLKEHLQSYVGEEHLYVIAASEHGDDANYEIAMNTRLFFLESSLGLSHATPSLPQICAYIQSYAMAELVSPDFNVDSSEYGIVTFGARLFNYKTIVESPLERAGQRAHDLCAFLYENVDFAQFGTRDIAVSDVKEALKSAIGDSDKAIPPSGDITTMPQIKHHSNLALALHTAYRKWALCLEDADAERLDRLPDSLSDEVIEMLGRCEHRRWRAMYASFGFTYLTMEQQLDFSRLLKGDNRRQVIEGLHKHSLLCPDEEIWDNYLHAVSSFGYLEHAMLDGGDTRIAVVSVDEAGVVSEGLHLQLLTRDYKVLEEWVVSGAKYTMRPLPDGEYLLHPATALEGWQAACDKRFSIRDGLLVDSGADDMRCPNTIVFSGKEKDWLGNDATLVNPVAYDWVFICAIGILRNR